MRAGPFTVRFRFQAFSTGFVVFCCGIATASAVPFIPKSYPDVDKPPGAYYAETCGQATMANMLWSAGFYCLPGMAQLQSPELLYQAIINDVGNAALTTTKIVNTLNGYLAGSCWRASAFENPDYEFLEAELARCQRIGLGLFPDGGIGHCVTFVGWEEETSVPNFYIHDPDQDVGPNGNDWYALTGDVADPAKFGLAGYYPGGADAIVGTAFMICPVPETGCTFGYLFGSAGLLLAAFTTARKRSS